MIAESLRAGFEAAVWSAAGRNLTAGAVERIVAAADQYAAEHALAVTRARSEANRRPRRRRPRRQLRHLDDSGTDLYPAIAALAELLLGSDAP